MQLLILLEDAASAPTLGATTVYGVAGRLVLVEAASADAFARHPAVTAVTDRVLPEDLAGRLTETEAVFAAAFAARTEKSERIGDGLAWDAAGFEPPDALHESTITTERGERTAVEREDDDV